MIMELPQPRPYGGEGRKPTHDFLSLCSHSSTHHQDPTPPSQGGFLKTHDFLGKTSAKEEAGSEMSSSVLEKPSPPAPPHSVEHLLPGGIGTYSISHISYFNQQRAVPKPEAGAAVFSVAQASSSDRNEENSNCSSYANSGFTLWDESAAKKGKTGKENIQTSAATDAATFGQQWASPEKPTQSSSNNNHRGSFSSLSSSQPTGHKSQSFMDMIKSAKSGSNQDEELLDDDDGFSLKKEMSPVPKGELRIKVDGKSSDQKANTPRSKHSATEQRRRSKINDRFQKLRGLIPHSDQKRDKASFLLEVIEYIQFLQEKVHKYEGSYQGWNNDSAKLMPWRNGQRPREHYVDPSRALSNATAPALIFTNENKITAVPTIPRNAQVPLESETSTSTTFKAEEPHPGLTNAAVRFPMTLHPNALAPVRTGSVGAQLSPRVCPDAENGAAQLTPQIGQTNPCANEYCGLSDKLKEQDLAIEGGTISISSAYSRGLLNTLTQALQSSGVDLSQANISVQIELGKRANSRQSIPTSASKENEIPPRNPGPRIASEDSEQPLKKLKGTKI